MPHTGTLSGFWILRHGPPANAPTAVLGRVQEELYLLAFVSVAAAARVGAVLDQGATPFYVCRANVSGLLRELSAVGARGFIVDYDPERLSFASAHPLPRPREHAGEVTSEAPRS
jgi:hypothetical protein